MAIEIKGRRLPISPAEAESYIQSQTDNFGVFFDVDRCFELSAILQLEMKDVARQMKRLAGEPLLALDDKEEMFNTYLKLGVRKSEFFTKGNSITLDAKVRKRIMENMTYSEDARVFAKLHTTYVSNKRNKGAIENFATESPMCKVLSKLNHRMALGRPHWYLLNTSRLAAADPGLQGIPRSMPDIVCEPKGYTLIRADSGQIEPRINFSHFVRDDLIANLIIHYDDAYFGIWRFCVMSTEEREACRKDFEKNFKHIEISDEIKEERQNIKTLTNAGSYGSVNLDKVNPALADAYDKYIVKHPARLALEQSVRDQYRRGDNTFYGYFGTPVTPGDTERYEVGSSGWDEHVIRCGVNNPVQTTASELMMFSINEARKIISEAKDTHICFYKHDEACFYVSDEDMANGVGEKLKEVTAYNVEGWIPIKSDAVVGIKHGDYPSYI